MKLKAYKKVGTVKDANAIKVLEVRPVRDMLHGNSLVNLCTLDDDFTCRFWFQA
jgi:hypothetical protein